MKGKAEAAHATTYIYHALFPATQQTTMQGQNNTRRQIPDVSIAPKKKKIEMGGLPHSTAFARP